MLRLAVLEPVFRGLGVRGQTPDDLDDLHALDLPELLAVVAVDYLAGAAWS
jgi:hypothetical protein